MICAKKLKIILIIFLVILLIILFSRLIKSIQTEKIFFKSKSLPNLVQENTNISYVESTDGKIVPVPMGYTESKIEEERSVDGGFVIYEGDINWDNLKEQNLADILNNKSQEKELLQLQSSYNQYVWVPVNEEDIKSIYGVDINGKLWGKLYSYNLEGRTPLDWKIVNDKISVKANSNYFEPGLGYGANSAIVNEMNLKQKLNMNREELTRELEQSYYETIKSIKKYGGFYIGRYETAIANNKAVVKKMNENISKQSWAEMYKKIQKIRGENDNVITSLIWSSLWDYTIEWFVNTGSKTYNEIYSSDSWGNYTSSEFEYYTDFEANTSIKNLGSGILKIIPSGSSEYTKVNNIYDMAGNVNELTLGCYAQNFSYRGGYYGSSSTTEKSCAFRSYQSIIDVVERTGSRAILLLK